MKKEKSCGAVVYKEANGMRLYLIQHMALGHYSIPKGHVEGEESEEETALREIKEETGLDVILDTNFRRVITYSPYPDIEKDVVFFIGKVVSSTIFCQIEEVTECEYLPFAKMVKKLTFDSDKETVRLAEEYLKAKENAK